MKFRVSLHVCDYWLGKTKSERERAPWPIKEFIVELADEETFMNWRRIAEDKARMAAEREPTESKRRLWTGLCVEVKEI